MSNEKKSSEFSLRKGKSWSSELQNTSEAKLKKIARGKGTQANKARKMLKLMKETERLMNKVK